MTKIAPPTNPSEGKADTSETDKLNQEFVNSKNSLLTFRVQWETFLDTAYARITSSNGFKSRVREGTLSSLLWERTARVVAQLPTGKIQALRKDDMGKSQIMDIVWHKYVIPGANTDYSFFTKLRMWDYYSMVYGACAVLYDYRVDDEYVGPDFTVLDPRYVYPQAGRLSFQRCQYVFIEANHNREYLKAKQGQKGWNDANISKILAQHSEGTQPDNSQHTTNLQKDRGQTIDLHKGEIQLVTKYERGKAGHWITFAPQYDNVIVRDIPNPHKSGRLPVVFKFCFPLLDSLWGMGDIERGQSLQNAIDSFVNMSMDFAKFDLYPVAWYGEGVNASQLRYEPGAKWKLPHGAESAGFLKTNSTSSDLMNTGTQFLSAALNRQNGTTTTQVSSKDGDPTQGKTPQAIDKNAATENSRDNWDRSMLEDAINELSNGMINLIGTKQPSSIEMHIFDDDIKNIYDSGGKDVLEIFDSAKKPKVTDEGELSWELSGKGAAKLTISPDDVKGAYRYQMDSGTTMSTDETEEYVRLKELGDTIGTPEGQQMVAALAQNGRQFDYAAYFKKRLIASGIEDWEEIIPETKDQGAQQYNSSMLQDPQAQQMQQQQAQQQQADMQKQITDKATEMAKQMMAQMPKKQPQEMIAYKDASPLTKAHMEQAAGWTPDPVHQLEEQALMAQHAATTVNSNMQMATPPQDPNAVETNTPQPAGVGA